MTDKDLEIWREKTKGIFHITEYRRFWNYIDSLRDNKQKYMKNGVFSLEYDKETLKDMVLELQEKIEKAKECLNNFNVFERFSFPLMKRWEEEQVKSSIDYEFKDTLKKDLFNIFGGEENDG